MSEEIKHGYDRVSDIISPFTGIEFVDDYILSRAANKGTEVHAYIEGYLKGWRWELIPSHVRPYFDCWVSWATKQPWFSLDHGKTIEKRFYSDEYNITGQIDLMYESDDGTILYDWKTSSKESISWKLQGAAYWELARRNNIKDPSCVHFVHLSKDHEAKVYCYDDTPYEYWDTFKNCLDLYRYFDMKNTRRKKQK